MPSATPEARHLRGDLVLRALVRSVIFAVVPLPVLLFFAGIAAEPLSNPLRPTFDIALCIFFMGLSAVVEFALEGVPRRLGRDLTAAALVALVAAFGGVLGVLQIFYLRGIASGRSFGAGLLAVRSGPGDLGWAWLLVAVGLALIAGPLGSLAFGRLRGWSLRRQCRACMMVSIAVLSLPTLLLALEIYREEADPGVFVILLIAECVVIVVPGLLIPPLAELADRVAQGLLLPVGQVEKRS